MSPPRKYQGECDFDGCDREARVLGWCRGHYRQHYEGRPLAPIRERRRFEAPSPDTRICTKCLRVKALDDFYVRTNGNRQTRCKVCMIEDARVATLRRRAENEARSRLVEPFIKALDTDSQTKVDGELERANV